MKIPPLTLPHSLHPHRSVPRDAHSAAEEQGGPFVHHVSHTIVQRTPSGDGPTSSSTCQPGDNSAICQKPAIQTTTATLPIVLGAVIPICCAIVVFYFLHRRHLKKQRIEDANDPHKSLDFGLGGLGGAGARGMPEMKVKELQAHDPTRPGQKPRGFSMDMGSPYLLPAGLQGSHESIRSMSRSMTHDEYDPYRPIGFLRPSGESNRPRFGDNGSVYSASTGQVSEKANLVRNASRMSQSYPKRDESAGTPVDSKLSTPLDSEYSSPQPQPATAQTLSFDHTSPPPPQKDGLHGEAVDVVESGLLPLSEPSSDFKSLPPPPPPPPEPVEEEATRSPRVISFSQPRPPRKDSAPASRHENTNRESSNSFEDHREMAHAIPTVNEPQPEMDENDYYYEDEDPDMVESGRYSIDDPTYLGHEVVQEYAQNQRLSVMGVRPLPPEHVLLEDNPEQRANRIRSFYKEYFDDSNKDRNTAYFDDGYYDDGVLDGAIYDPETGAFYMPEKPFAQGPGRRAMTPPPRGAPRPMLDDVHRRQFSTMSAGRGPFRGRPPPKQKLPPPKALQGLPTPAKLGYDSALFNPIDFAPPTSFREMQNGRRPDSPMGMARPYSPSVRPFTPLASAYDDLPSMPSPHLLRKSGTFTALDFAPPKLSIRDAGGSDAGSIRSARSGISAMQLDAVRAGAYRVSRIPKEMVTTREEMTNQLRPKLNMISPA